MHLPRVRGKAGIYIIICRANCRFYIGSSKDLRARWVAHRSDLRRGDHGNQHLQHAWAKYGESQFTVGVMEYCPESDIISREQHYLDTYRAYEIGFNINPQAGTCEGRPHSDKAKAKIRAFHIGRKHSPETCKRMSESRRRNTAWVRRRTEKEYTLVSPSGEIVSGRNVSAFARERGLQISNVRLVLRGLSKHTEGWRLPTTDPSALEPSPPWRVRDPYGVLYVIPHSARVAFSRQHNLTSDQLGRVVSGRKECYRGWCHADRLDLYVVLLNPEGQEVTICRRWRSAFCLEHSLVEQGLDGLLSGKLLTHHGWRLKEPVRVPPTKTIVDPLGVSHSIPSQGLSLFCRNHNLNYCQIHRVMQGCLAGHEGWHLP